MPGLLGTEKGLVALVASVTGEQGVTYYQQHTRGSKPGGGFIGRPGVNGIRHDLYYVVDPKTFFDLKEIKKRFTKYFGKEEQLEVQRINRDDDKEELLLLGNRFVAGDKIGVHWLGHKLDIEANLKIVSEVYKTADWVFVSNHSHENIPYRDVGNLPADYIVDYAHDCIDAGADAFFGHGDYMGEGIEIYEDRPIFYSLAMPLYSGKSYGRIPPAGYELLGLSQDATQSEAYEASVRAFGGTDYSRWLRALLAVFKLEGEKGSRRLTELKLYPIDGGIDKPPSQFGQRPMLVKNKVLAKKIIDRYNILSAPFGTKIDFKDGIGIVKL
jgi:poly-gamma-glutamate synthesis protein (capsule biosynthesis protein)